jgi:hypothetical protein
MTVHPEITQKTVLLENVEVGTSPTITRADLVHSSGKGE